MPQGIGHPQLIHKFNKKQVPPMDGKNTCKKKAKFSLQTYF